MGVSPWVKSVVEEESWLGEDGVSADSTPNDVWLVGQSCFAVFKRCTTVVGPRHFEDSRGTLNTFHSKPLSKSSLSLAVLHEMTDGSEEHFLLFTT